MISTIYQAKLVNLSCAPLYLLWMYLHLWCAHTRNHCRNFSAYDSVVQLYHHISFALSIFTGCKFNLHILWFSLPVAYRFLFHMLFKHLLLVHLFLTDNITFYISFFYLQCSTQLNILISQLLQCLNKVWSVLYKGCWMFGLST